MKGCPTKIDGYFYFVATSVQHKQFTTTWFLFSYHSSFWVLRRGRSVVPCFQIAVAEKNNRPHPPLPLRIPSFNWKIFILFMDTCGL